MKFTLWFLVASSIPAFAQPTLNKTKLIEFTQQSTFCQAVFVPFDRQALPAHINYFCDNGPATYNFEKDDGVTNPYQGLMLAHRLISPQLTVRFCGAGSGQRANCTFMQETAVRNGPSEEITKLGAHAEFCYVKVEKGWFDTKNRALVVNCDNGTARHQLIDSDQITTDQAGLDWARSLLPELKIGHCEYYFGGSCLFIR